MEYREIVAVTGIGGLFQLMATKADGAIVRNLQDKTTKFISARLHNVTPLESIEVYTTGDNVRLHEVFQKMKDSSIKMVDGKADNNAIKAYFKGIFPEFDDERVYVSDMKKMLKWFELLKANDLLDFSIYEQQNGEETTEVAEVAEEAPAPKAKAKKSADEDAATEKAEKPKKAAKKKADTAELFAEGDAATEKPAKKAPAKKKKPEE